MSVNHETAEPPRVIVCAGPPACALLGDEAIEAAQRGCVWCKRITLWADGTETVSEPGHA